MARSIVLVLYLTAYNFAQALGWGVVLLRILGQAARKHSIEGTFDAAGDLVRLLQLSAFLEVVHAAAGIVPSGALTSFLQWGGRYHWIAAVVCNIKEVQRLPSVFITFAAWSLTEVVRYPQYALSTIGLCPWWLTWLRYSVFIPLYPIGALCGEGLAISKAVKSLQQSIQSATILLQFCYGRFDAVCIPVAEFIHLHVQEAANFPLYSMKGIASSLALEH
ncbi:hypothetical protein GOP47_0004394 [Adiantum capillus-veneris]|uniref:Very-long-chain (3R)-3-hydroxyacyl-CoA dehydratase n=1 Tax=Adiantum capillus-veneris TaxID=13818 RepID=A0A9D4V7E2_ADICA|nr:hypothetical protein GOP47_0004394 [Adiantum capillus-veneris]